VLTLMIVYQPSIMAAELLGVGHGLLAILGSVACSVASGTLALLNL